MNYDPQLTNASDDELLQSVYMDTNASPRERALAERLDTKTDELAYERDRVEDIEKSYANENAELQEYVARLEKQIEKVRAHLRDAGMALA